MRRQKELSRRRPQARVVMANALKAVYAFIMALPIPKNTARMAVSNKISSSTAIARNLCHVPQKQLPHARGRESNAGNFIRF
ncbi:MAG: hypothetical protein CMI18_12565 [Opitutaceae bacterium]|nr:hypothetical protein [Opitutaceae bacterium]